MKRDLTQIISKYKEYTASGKGSDAVLSRLYEEGVSIIDSMKVIRALYGINLAEAKRIVSVHPIWKAIVHPTQTLFEEIMVLEPDATYGDWLEVYQFGFQQRGKLRIAVNRAMQNEVETLLESAKSAEKEIQRDLIQQLVHYSDEIVKILIVLLYEHDVSLWILIISTLHEIGFPRNALAIPWLVDIAIDPHPVALNEVMIIYELRVTIFDFESWDVRFRIYLN